MLVMPLETHAKITQQLQKELAVVEECFRGELKSELTCVNELVGHVERYRGKMFRPTLVLSAGLAVSGGEVGGNGQKKKENSGVTSAHHVVAAVVEMVHMATLVHDDVLDEAEVRRRGKTLNYLAGNETAVMLGDFLFSHAYHLVSKLKRPEVAGALCEATNVVCEGELLQLTNRNNWGLDEPLYLQIVGYKTAALCGVSCRMGAMLSGASEGQVKALGDFGDFLGIAYQIIDDLLDLTGDQATVGKTLGRDLQKGKLTLPLIRHISVAKSRGESGEIEALLMRIAKEGAAKPLEEATTEQIRRWLESGDALSYTAERAKAFVEKAKRSLMVLPESQARAFLMDAADAVIARRF